MRNEAALASHAYSGTNIVACDHTTRQMSSTKGVNVRGCAGFQLVLENNETEELEIRLRNVTGTRSISYALRYYCLNGMHIPPHSLCSKPRQTFNGFASNSDDTEPISSVVRKHIVIIMGNCKQSQSAVSSVDVLFPLHDEGSHISGITSGAPLT